LWKQCLQHNHPDIYYYDFKKTNEAFLIDIVIKAFSKNFEKQKNMDYI